MDSGLDLVRRMVAEALEAGADEAEATLGVSKRFSCEARGASVAKLEQSVSRGLTVRVYVKGAKGTLSTTDLSGGLRDAVHAAVEAARYVVSDPYAGLSDEPASAPLVDLAIADDAVRQRAAPEKIAEALELERLIRAYDPRITNSGGSRVSDTAGSLAYANSRGSEGTYLSTAAVRSTSPIALDGAIRRNAGYGTASRRLAGLETIAAVATQAAQRAVSQCGSRKPHSMKAPVIFERDVAASVLGDVFSAISASSVDTGNSFLIGKIGEAVGSKLVTIVDDGLLPGGLGTSPFDAEGTPARRTVVFERGVLSTYLYDSYYARKLGAKTTGNAAGGGIGPNNFYLEPGAGSLEDLIAATPRGVLVLETIGFSTESATGTYSRGARGFMIEDGALSYPIEEFTIAGNLPAMLSAVDRVAGDLRFDGAVVSPSFRVAEMTISGT